MKRNSTAEILKDPTNVCRYSSLLPSYNAVWFSKKFSKIKQQVSNEEKILCYKMQLGDNNNEKLITKNYQF